MSAVSGSRASNTVHSQKMRGIVANPNGSREERRAAKRLGVALPYEIEEVDGPCCTPMDEAHTLPNGHTMLCRDEMNRERR